MKNLKKKSEKKIRKVEKLIRNIPVTPQTFTQAQLYQTLQELQFQGQYDLVCKICNALLDK